MNRISRARLVLAVSGVLVFILLSLRGYHRGDLSDVRELFHAWDLAAASALLERLPRPDTPDPAFDRMAAEVFLARGELRRAEALSRGLASRPSPEPSDLLGLAWALFHLGALDSSSAVLNDAAARTPETDAAMLGRIHHLRGLISFNTARYEDAQRHQSRSLALARQAGDSALVADAMRQIAVLAWYAGRVSEALPITEDALRLYRMMNDRIGEATALSNIGLLLNDKGDRVKAAQYQVDAFRIRRTIGDLRGQADSYYFLTNGPFGARDKPFQYAYRRKSYELSTRIGYAWGREVALRALDELPFSRFMLSASWSTMNDSTASFEDRIHWRWWEARHFLASRSRSKAIPILEEIIRECEKHGYEISRRVAIRNLAAIYLELGRSAEAERTLALEDPGENLLLLSSRDLLVARLQLQQGRTAAARALLSKLAASSDSLYLREIGNPEGGFERAVESVALLRSGAYQLLVESMMGQSTDRVFEVMERERTMPLWVGDGGAGQRDLASRYVDLLDRLDNDPGNSERMEEFMGLLADAQQSLLVEGGRNGTAASGRPARTENPDSRAVSAALGPREILLEYFVMQKDILAVVLKKGREPRMVRLGVRPDDVASATRVFLDAIARGKAKPEDGAWRGPGAFLYHSLVEPLQKEGLLTPGAQVIISPHRFLHGLPFHALAPPGGDPVLTLYNISYVPSATSLWSVRQSPANTPGTFLGIVPRPKSLPYTLKEISGIPDSLFGIVHVLKGPRAVLEAVGSAVGRYDVVHIASHASASSEFPLYSSIELYDRKWRLHEVFRQNLPSRLIVLSACETGAASGLRSDEMNSEEIVSFPRAFLHAGVPTVISSAWLAEDKRTAELMTAFYAGLSNNESLGAAFANAQRTMMRNGGGFLHPFYWAGFSLTGDSR